MSVTANTSLKEDLLLLAQAVMHAEGLCCPLAAFRGKARTFSGGSHYFMLNNYNNYAYIIHKTNNNE